MNHFENSHVDCANCAAARFCLPVGLELEHLAKLSHLISNQFNLKKGEVFIRPNDPFSSFYAVRKGALKSYLLDYEGREQIWGIYLIGELFGFEGVEQSAYPYYVECVEDTTICELPYQHLLQLLQELPELQQQMLKLMSQRLVVDLGLPRNNASTERVASFLLSLSTRFQRRGLSASEFTLPLSRQEIANYLGLTLETVSRIFSRMKNEGIISAQGKQIKILSFRELQKCAAC